MLFPYYHHKHLPITQTYYNPLTLAIQKHFYKTLHSPLVQFLFMDFFSAFMDIDFLVSLPGADFAFAFSVAFPPSSTTASDPAASLKKLKYYWLVNHFNLQFNKEIVIIKLRSRLMQCKVLIQDFTCVRASRWRPANPSCQLYWAGFFCRQLKMSLRIR